jgi:hypothetical protein
MKIEDIPFVWARDEVQYPGEIRRNGRGKHVRTVQEWLSYHRFATAIDGAFGPATEVAVRDFQTARGLRPTGVVDARTHAALVRPLLEVLQPIESAGRSFPELVLAYARQHVARRPIELGSENAGPWVRLYMEGRDGATWPWCAGFVTFLMKQAARYSGSPMPVPGSPSCDTLAAQAKETGRFVRERELARAGRPAVACVFLVRRTPTDWVHTGLVTRFEDRVIRTIEGNTNDSGSREGFEAVERARGYAAKDYIALG